jgi:hypothetical protein
VGGLFLFMFLAFALLDLFDLVADAVKGASFFK